MANLQDIRAGIAANLTAHLDLAPLTGCQISPYMLSAPTTPTVQVMGPDLITYHRAMADGVNEWTLIVQAFVGLISDQGAQQVLDRMLDTTGAASVKAAIEADGTLGGAAFSTTVVSSSGYRQYQLGGQADVLGCEWSIQILGG